MDTVWQDVSRLIDICRQSIVFQDLSGIACCLAAIHKDDEIRVMRVKNRMDTSYDSSCSAGYRDVALNLRIVNNETKDLGVETHVCEVQLIHRAFAERKVFYMHHDFQLAHCKSTQFLSSIYGFVSGYRSLVTA